MARTTQNLDCTGCWIFEIRLKEVEASPFLSTCNLVGMVFIIGITSLSDIKMLMMCNTVFVFISDKDYAAT